MRDITTEMLDAYSAANVQPAILAELYFDSGTLRLWTGLGTLNWNGEEYIGGGNLVSISEIKEQQGLEANGMVATLSGVPSTIISLVLLENQRGRPFRLYLAAVQTPGTILQEGGDDILLEDGSGSILLEAAQLVTSPYRIFNGLMDTIEIIDSAETATINVNVESIMIVGQRSKVSRYTPEDQKKTYSTDKGLDFIPSLQDKEVVW